MPVVLGLLFILLQLQCLDEEVPALATKGASEVVHVQHLDHDPTKSSVR